MTLTIIFSAITCLMMIVGVLFIPKIKIFKFKIDSYWLFTLIGAFVVVLVSGVDFKVILNSLTADTSINPIKILVLFISMTVLSLFLDELGFFR
jgi:arsenical pump membrane protein